MHCSSEHVHLRPALIIPLPLVFTQLKKKPKHVFMLLLCLQRMMTFPSAVDPDYCTCGVWWRTGEWLKRKIPSCYKQWLHLTTSFFVSHAGLQTGSFRDPSSTLWLQIFIEESSVSEAMLLVCVLLYFWLLLHTPSVSLAQSVRLWVCDRGTLISARWICH